MFGVPKWPGDRIGTGEACLVYQSGQEIGLVQEGACLCLPRLSRERDGAFCSRSGLPRLSLERDGAFCSREGSSEVVS